MGHLLGCPHLTPGSVVPLRLPHAKRLPKLRSNIDRVLLCINGDPNFARWEAETVEHFSDFRSHLAVFHIEVEGASGGTSNLKSLTKGWYSFAAIHGVFPGTGIELANLIKRKLADRTRPVRGSINSRVVHKHDLPIPSVADIHLDGVRADFESASNRRESILRCRPRRAPVSNQQDFVVCRRRTFRYKRCGSEKQHNRCSPSRKTMVHSHLEKAESLILEAFRAPRGQAFGAVSSHSNTRSAGVADTCGLIAPALLAVSDLSDPGYCQARTSRSMLHP